ncbi:NfeD family protein [Thalassospiraceae bacterium LMO-JJ14]|nr:NfeD family protein [Thalassospiraceae bacterium LMO-JJ14]
MQEGFDIHTVMSGITFWYWWILAVVLVILELMAPGVIFLWLGAAAVVSGFILFAVPDIAWQQQFLIFAVLSVVSVVAGRLWWAKRSPTESDHPTLNRRGQQYIGRTFKLNTAIEDGVGRITVDDTTWRVNGDDMPAGTHVTVTGVDGATFKVERVALSEE